MFIPKIIKESVYYAPFYTNHLVGYSVEGEFQVHGDLYLSRLSVPLASLCTSLRNNTLDYDMPLRHLG